MIKWILKADGGAFSEGYREFKGIAFATYYSSEEAAMKVVVGIPNDFHIEIVKVFKL